MAAGTIALCLEANPELTWRDVQGVLLSSTAMTDPTDEDWTVNGAGYFINHKYGFGRINATAAVETALSWEFLTESESINTGTLIVDQTIPDHDMGELSVVWHCTSSITVEHVDIFLMLLFPIEDNLK